MKTGILAFGLAALTAVAAASSATAQSTAEPAPPAAPTPAPELNQLSFFEGTWTCLGQANAGPTGPQHATEATAHIRRDLGGFWYMGRYEEKKTAQNPHPVGFAWVWGYDQTSKSFVQVGFDNFGNHVRETSTGWENGTIVFADSASRDTFTKKGDAELEHHGEIQAQGKWIAQDRETCKRAGG